MQTSPTIRNRFLAEAVQTGSRPEARKWLRKGARPDAPVLRFNDLTALHLAATQASTFFCRLLLEARASADVVGPEGVTALMMVCGDAARAQPETARAACCRLLLASNAQVDARKTDNMEGQTALMTAAQHAGHECISVLLAAGAALEIHTVRGLATPLICAVFMGCDSSAQALIKARANVNHRDAVQETSLHIAARHGDVPMVKLLLEAQADAALRCGDERTALEISRECEANVRAGQQESLRQDEFRAQHAYSHSQKDHKTCMGLLQNDEAAANADTTNRINTSRAGPQQISATPPPLLPLEDDSDLEQQPLPLSDPISPYDDLLWLRVRIDGLQARPELNGTIGRTFSFNAESGRYTVLMTKGTRVAIKAGNLSRMISPPPQPGVSTDLAPAASIPTLEGSEGFEGLKRGCAICGLQLGAKRCAGCRVVRYCCTEHQTTAWKSYHKLTCGKPLPSPASIHDSSPAVLATVMREVHSPSQYTQEQHRHASYAPSLSMFSQFGAAHAGLAECCLKACIQLPQPVLVSSGVLLVPVVTRLMQTHAPRGFVQERACHALLLLISDGKQTLRWGASEPGRCVTQAIEAGAISSVMQCLRMHWSDPRTFQRAIIALGSLCVGLDRAALEVRDAAAEQGAIFAAAHGLKVYQTDNTIVLFALATLSTLCMNESSTLQAETRKQQMILDADIMSLVLSLLRREIDGAVLRIEIAATLVSGSLRAGTHGQTPLIFFINAYDGGAISIFANQLHISLLNSSVVCACLRAIMALCGGLLYAWSDPAAAAVSLRHAGAFEAALLAVWKCAQRHTNWQVLELCLHAIATLLQAEDAPGCKRKDLAIRLGILPYVKAILRQFEQMPTIATHGCSIIYNLSLAASAAGCVERQQEILDADLLSTILLVMNAHPNQLSVQYSAVGTLFTLSAGTHPPFIRFATLANEAHVVDSIKRTLALHDNAELQKKGAAVIHNLTAVAAMQGRGWV